MSLEYSLKGIPRQDTSPQPSIRRTARSESACRYNPSVIIQSRENARRKGFLNRIRLGTDTGSPELHRFLRQRHRWIEQILRFTIRTAPFPMIHCVGNDSVLKFHRIVPTGWCANLDAVRSRKLYAQRKNPVTAYKSRPQPGSTDVDALKTRIGAQTVHKFIFIVGRNE